MQRKLEQFGEMDRSETHCFRNGLLALAVGTLCVPQVALACSPQPVIIIETDTEVDCEALWQQARDLATETPRAEAFDTLVDIARKLANASSKCLEESRVATLALNKQAGSPLADHVVGAPASHLLRLASQSVDVSPQRLKDIALREWLTNSRYSQGFCSPGRYYSVPPQGWEKAEVREALVQRENWALAVTQPAGNPMRDHMVLETLLDRSSPLSDITRARDLALQMPGLGPRLRAAAATTDPRYAAPDYETAAELLEKWSPYVENSLSEEENQQAHTLWTRISQSRLASGNEKLRKDALARLMWDDPTARHTPHIDFYRARPDNHRWMDSGDLAPMDMRSAQRIAGDYPTRALRRGHGGSVRIGAVYDEHGAFVALQVLKAAETVLVQAAMRGFQRYWRPRLTELDVGATAGKRTTVVLPEIEYRIGKRDDVAISPKRITITRAPPGQLRPY